MKNQKFYNCVKLVKFDKSGNEPVTLSKFHNFTVFNAVKCDQSGKLLRDRLSPLNTNVVKLVNLEKEGNVPIIKFRTKIKSI